MIGCGCPTGHRLCQTAGVDLNAVVYLDPTATQTMWAMIEWTPETAEDREEAVARTGFYIR